MTVAELLARLQATSIDPAGFRISARLENCFAGRAPSGRAAVIVPCSHGSSAVGRASGAILVTFLAVVAFEVEGESWTTSAVALECLDESVLQTFAALAIDLAAQLARGPNPAPASDVLRALALWERLLRNRSLLSEERQMGLWGELEFIRTAHSVDGAVRAWNPDPKGVIDFVHHGLGIEIKTSTTRLKHSMSQRQADAIDGEVRVLLGSLWVVPDAAGRSLSSLVRELFGLTAETILFEQKVLAAGFSHRDADTYSRRWSVGEQMLLFEGASLPRVREVDVGVSSVRYVVELESDAALCRDHALDAVRRLCGEPTL